MNYLSYFMPSLDGFAEYFLKTVGIDNQIKWFMANTVAYILFGYGGHTFDSRVSRFRNIKTGQFASWISVIAFGSSIDACIFIVFVSHMDSLEQTGFIWGALLAIILTFLFEVTR